MSVNKAGTARLTNLSTAGDSDANGAGIIEAREGFYDQNASERVRLALCDPNAQAGRGLSVMMDPITQFSADCNVNGRIESRAGEISQLPQHLFDETGEGMKITSDELLNSGVRKIWINASVVNVERQKNHYLVTIRLINSGRENFSFKRPDLWSGDARDEIMRIGGINANPKEDGGWRFELAGKPLANKSDFDSETVTLAGGAHRDFVFEALPVDAYKAGTYAFSLTSWLYLNWKDGEQKRLDHVDFYSGTKGRTTIKLEYDYPSTPEEREQYEKNHRENMSRSPVLPGATFAENGLYRAVRPVSGYRSLQLKHFKAGDVATTDKVRMLVNSGNGDYLDGPVQWEWAAIAPTPIKQWSFDLIEDTQQFCKTGATCPRSGRWVPRMTAGTDWLRPKYRLDLSRIVTLRRGQPMPVLHDTDEGTDWEWVGA